MPSERLTFKLVVVLWSSALAFSAPNCSCGTWGFDVSWPVDSDTMACMKTHGHDFAIIGLQDRDGNLSSSAFSNMANAKSAGLATLVEVLVQGQGDPASSAAANVAAAAAAGVLQPNASIFVILSGQQDGSWGSNTTQNAATLHAILSAIARALSSCSNPRGCVGIMADELQYNLIVGPAEDSFSRAGYPAATTLCGGAEMIILPQFLTSYRLAVTQLTVL